MSRCSTATVSSHHRFPAAYALHGGPPRRRALCVFLPRATAGSLARPVAPAVVAEVRAGLNMRNVAVSGDGRWIMAANYLPHSLALFDADLNLGNLRRGDSLDGKAARACPRCTTPRRGTALSWRLIFPRSEISYDPEDPPTQKPAKLGVRRTP